MSSDWPIQTLSDVCEKITDGAHHSPKSVEKGRPMASVKDLTRFGVDLSEARLITESEFEKLVSQGCQPKVGDILIAKDGNSALDTVCTVDQPLDAVMLSSVAILRPDKSKLDSDFLKYYFCSKQVIDYLKGNFISGAAIPRVVLKDFRKAEIKVPPLNIQKQISKKLRTLDDKIELNRQTNQTLEHIAQAIFKSWFVDFEPTRAKITAKQAGQDPERAAMAAISGKSLDELDQLSSEQLAQLKTTAALFPDALVESELGEVPEGWGVSCLGSFINFANGKSLKANEKGEYPVYGANGIIGRADVSKFSNAVIIGRVGAYCGAVAYSLGGFWASDNTIVASPKKQCAMLPYIFFQLQILDLNQYAGGAAQPLLNQTTLKAIEVVFSSEALILHYAILVQNFLENITSNISQNSSLEEVRDTLLPKLLSGELPTSEIPSVSPEQRLQSKTFETKESTLQQKSELIEGSPPLQKGEQGGFQQQNRQPPKQPRTPQ